MKLIQLKLAAFLNAMQRHSMGVSEAQIFRLTQMRDLSSNYTFVIEIRNIIVRTEEKTTTKLTTKKRQQQEPILKTLKTC